MKLPSHIKIENDMYKLVLLRVLTKTEDGVPLTFERINLTDTIDLTDDKPNEFITAFMKQDMTM